MFKLALIQMHVLPGRKRENLRHAGELLTAAADQGAKVAVLPEAMPLGWTDGSALELADEIPGGESCETLREWARDLRLHLCSGLVERSNGRIYNSAILFGPDGELLLHHRKINELEIAHDRYAQGDRLAVAPTPLGCFGVMICSDAFARDRVISRTLGLMGAEVILSPCAWAVPAGHDNAQEPYGGLWRNSYGPVARDFRMWIAGVSNVGAIDSGPWAGRKCIGGSLLVGPSGETVMQGPYGAEAETILYAEIAPAPRAARGDGWERIWKAT